MTKEKLRQQKLSFTKTALRHCEKGVVTPFLKKQLRNRFLFLIGLGIFLLLFFMNLLRFTLNNKTMIVAQMGKEAEIPYYIFAVALLLFVLMFFWMVIKDILKYRRIKSESISMIKVGIDDMEYCITNNRSMAPYLKVKSFNFGPILPLNNLADIFDENKQYLFYYSSKSHALLAVGELKD